MPNIHLSSSDGRPHATVKPKIGENNIGLYCEACGDFIALAVSKAPPGKSGMKIIADEPQPFECRACQHLQRRNVSEIQEIRLTAGNRRRPPPQRH